MKKERSDTRETRRRILSAASEVFAEKGFWEATNADICGKADVNSAAVNYHFGSKENLYVEAWKHSFERSLDTHPIDGGIRPGSPASERLYGAILSFIQRLTDPNTHDLEITHKEMVNSTGLLRETIPKALDPLYQAFRSIIQELLGCSASDQRIPFCIMSITSQCFGVLFHLRAAKQGFAFPLITFFQPDFDLDKIVEHITQFSLAGIRICQEQAIQNQEDRGNKILTEEFCGGP